MVRYIVNILLLYYHKVLTIYVDYKLYMTHIKVKCIQTSEIGCWVVSPVCHQVVFAMIAHSEIAHSIHMWLTRRHVAQKCQYVSTALCVALHYRRPWSLSLIWSGHITDVGKQGSNIKYWWRNVLEDIYLGNRQTRWNLDRCDHMKSCKSFAE